MATAIDKFKEAAKFWSWAEVGLMVQCWEQDGEGDDTEDYGGKKAITSGFVGVLTGGVVVDVSPPNEAGTFGAIIVSDNDDYDSDQFAGVGWSSEEEGEDRDVEMDGMEVEDMEVENARAGIEAMDIDG